MEQGKELIHVYFMPGMAAAPTIFDHINLPENRFVLHFLEWRVPNEKESLSAYCKELADIIKNEGHKKIALIGVSFGGVIVQEMAKHLDLIRLIIISSVKCSDELPPRMKFAGKSGLFKLIPTSLVDFVDYFEKIAVGDFLKKRARLYKQYISVRDKRYLDWAIKNMVKWKCDRPMEDIIHIHGDMDEVFPAKNIEDAIFIKGGTHIMIINRFKWFNENLPGLIEKGVLEKEKNKILN